MLCAPVVWMVALVVLAPAAAAPLGVGWRGAARSVAGGSAEVAASLGGALLLKAYVLDARYIPTESMVPTFKVGDLLLLDKVSYRLRPPVRGDVVCFLPPPALLKLVPQLGGSNLCCIKRVVAVAGDEVRVRRGRLVVNGRVQAEPYVAQSHMADRMAPVRVPSGHYFVMGDNRELSLDSRIWGCVPQELLLGVPLCTYWPPKRWRRWRRGSIASLQMVPT